MISFKNATTNTINNFTWRQEWHCYFITIGQALVLVSWWWEHGISAIFMSTIRYDLITYKWPLWKSKYLLFMLIHVHVIHCVYRYTSKKYLSAIQLVLAMISGFYWCTASIQSLLSLIHNKTRLSLFRTFPLSLSQSAWCSTTKTKKIKVSCDACVDHEALFINNGVL